MGSALSAEISCRHGSKDLSLCDCVHIAKRQAAKERWTGQIGALTVSPAKISSF